MRQRLILIAVIAAAVAAFIALDLGRFLSLAALQEQRGALIAWRDAQPLAATLAFFAV